MTRWFRAACPVADGPAAHLDHAVLSSVDGLAADLVCTHVDRTGVVARTALTVGLRHERDHGALVARLGTEVIPVPGPPDGARFVRFPGQGALTGVVPAGDLVTRSAIDEVIGVGVPVAPDTPVDTMGFLRPTGNAGKLVLLVEPAAGGVLRPVEIEQPHQCCGGH